MGKSGIFFCTPLYRCSCIITVAKRNNLQSFFRGKSCIQSYLILIKGADVIYLFNRNHRQIFHTDFLSLIDKRKTSHKEIQSCQHFFTLQAYITFWNIVAYAPWLVMVFNNIRIETMVANFFLSIKIAFFVSIRCYSFAVIPSFIAASPYIGGKVKDRGEITSVPNKIRKLFWFFIKYFTNRKSIILRKSTSLQFT